MSTLSPQTSNPFGSAPIAAAPQMASQAALVQREVAEVQAAMIIAKREPRDPRRAMDLILNNCSREGLAERSIYQYARGGQDITGPSIRLAEELARGWGNILTGVTELSRLNGYSECLAYAWDLETNFRDEKRFQVKHWRDTKKGGYALTDERDIYETIANSGARRKRACILSVIPIDVQEAAVEQCELTMRTKINVTPEKIASMVAAFAEVGVTKSQLERRIQRRVETITPALMANLGKVFNSLKDGMSQVVDWFDPDPETPNGAPAPTSRAESVKDQIKQQTAPPAPKDGQSEAAAVGEGGVVSAPSPEPAAGDDRLPFDEGEEAPGQDSDGTVLSQRVHAIAVELGIWAEGRGVTLSGQMAARLGIEPGIAALTDMMAINKLELLHGILLETKAKNTRQPKK
jgi:hypothetical protein